MPSTVISGSVKYTVAAIGNEAFLQCENLASINIPGYVKTIGERAFAYCYKLESLSIGNSVETIGWGWLIVVWAVLMLIGFVISISHIFKKKNKIAI
jgi:hypothetical protein